MPYRHREPMTPAQLARIVTDLEVMRKRLTYDLDSFRIAVADALDDRDVTQAELAVGLKVTRKTVWKWAKDGREARDQRARARADRSGERGPLG